MEFEIRRHPWASLQGVAGDVGHLDKVMRDFSSAENRQDALHAAERINRHVLSNGLLCQAAASVASCLVHLLWRRSGCTEDLALGILADIAGAEVSEEDPPVYGPVSYEECIGEIALGFPAYVEILESSLVHDSRVACIDLILMCGLFREELRPKAIYFLRSAKVAFGFERHVELISSSIQELELCD